MSTERVVLSIVNGGLPTNICIEILTIIQIFGRLYVMGRLRLK